MSLKLFLSLQKGKIDFLQQQTAPLLKEDKVLQVIENSKKVFQEIEKGGNGVGIFVKWVNNSSISKFIEMFNIKK